MHFLQSYLHVFSLEHCVKKRAIAVCVGTNINCVAVLSAFSFSICKGRSCRGHVGSRCPRLVHTWPCTVFRPGPLGESAGW